jgi:phosphoribosylformylglycinamidine synthase
LFVSAKAIKSKRLSALSKAITDNNSMATKYHARIYVTLRSSVLDPAGTAVESGLKQMGYTEVESVRIGKYIEMQLSANDEEQAKQHLDAMCDRLLANTVIENYRFELTQMATA